MRGKAKRNDETLGPGPGGYNSQVEVVKDNSSAFKIGTEERKTKFGMDSREDIPGPGTYGDANLNLMGKEGP